MSNQIPLHHIIIGTTIILFKKLWFYIVIFACYFLYKLYLSSDANIKLIEIIAALIYIEVCKIKEIMKENNYYFKGLSTYTVLRSEGALKKAKEVFDEIYKNGN